MTRHPTRNLVLGFAALTLLTITLELAAVILRLAPLLFVAGLGLGVWWLCRRHVTRPRNSGRVPPPVFNDDAARFNMLATENAALWDQIDQLRGDLNDARLSAEEAWHAAATVAPRQVEAILHDRLFGGSR